MMLGTRQFDVDVLGTRDGHLSSHDGLGGWCNRLRLKDWLELGVSYNYSHNHRFIKVKLLFPSSFFLELGPHGRVTHGRGGGLSGPDAGGVLRRPFSCCCRRGGAGVGLLGHRERHRAVVLGDHVHSRDVSVHFRCATVLSNKPGVHRLGHIDNTSRTEQ